MRHYGYGDNGNVLIECTHDEYASLTMLAETVAGNAPALLGRRQQFDINRIDLKATFDAIMIWMLVRGYANSLRKLADQMDASLKVETNASDSHASDPAPQATPVSAGSN